MKQSTICKRKNILFQILLKYFQGISLEKYFEVEEIVEKIDINQRFDAPNEVPLCESVQRVLIDNYSTCIIYIFHFFSNKIYFLKVAFPVRAQTANGTWNYIVNQVEGKVQGVVVEECNVKK